MLPPSCSSTAHLIPMPVAPLTAAANFCVSPTNRVALCGSIVNEIDARPAVWCGAGVSCRIAVSNRGAITRKVDTSPWKRAPVDFIVSSDHTEFTTTPNNGDGQQGPKKLSFSNDDGSCHGSTIQPSGLKPHLGLH